MYLIVTCVDTDDQQEWQRHSSIVKITVRGQDSGLCTFGVQTTDHNALELALDHDLDVLEYEYGASS